MFRLRTWLVPTLAALALSVGLEARAQVRLLPKASVPAAPVDVLRQGEELEAARRWGEALSHYEDALREFPADTALHQRLDLARIHYGIVRRYHDKSFRRSLEKLDLQASLDVFDEVTLKIQSHYVEDPNWRQLVLDGTHGMQVALNNEAFAHEFLTKTTPEQRANFQDELVRRVNSRQITDRRTALDAVRVAGQIGEKTLGLPPAAVVLEYVSRAASVLDDYSTFLTPDQLGDLYSQIDGNFVGLGIELQAEHGMLVIIKVITGSPAEKGGLKARDQIVAVDGVDTSTLSTEKAAGLLQGPEGSLVEVAVQAPGEAVRKIQVRRQHVEVPSIDLVKIIDAKNGVGYLRLTSFQKTTPRELDDALWKLHRDGMRSLVMDLRGNPGGLLTTAVDVADRFISAGRIVSTKGRSPDQNWTYNAQKPGTWRVPLAVLIDRDSASAAEIFAGAIRDHQRGTLVGQTSYGKGSVQSIFTLGQGGAGLRLTTAKFYSPLGHPFSKVGVAPHVTVEQVAKPINGKLLEMKEDAVLQEGIRIARETPVARN